MIALNTLYFNNDKRLTNPCSVTKVSIISEVYQEVPQGKRCIGLYFPKFLILF